MTGGVRGLPAPLRAGSPGNSRRSAQVRTGPRQPRWADRAVVLGRAGVAGRAARLRGALPERLPV
ncbi:hypothetical protein ACF1B0_15755 [Streptomyces anandii]|uniref:hypothetical protein n=1 Tax=Streptomyces anandii TaxID=285454 RepID=UPI0036FAC5FC